MSKWFGVKHGARQGCPMLPCMAFNIFLDRVVRETQASYWGGMRLDICKVQVSLFADDRS